MIVGLGSTMGVGKDVAAEGLCRDLQFRRIGFADPIKALALEADPLILANSSVNVGIGRGRLRWLVSGCAGWDDAKRTYPEVRTFLQNLGVGGRTVFGEDFWVVQALSGVKPGERVVISDVRFRNEFNEIRDRGGKLIKIIRPGRDEVVGHISEMELTGPEIEWDAVVENNGSVVELQTKIVELVRGWLKAETGDELKSATYLANINGPDPEHFRLLGMYPPPSDDLGAGDESRVEH